ncbi:hypothetical protein FCY33_23640, partial [Escherichia coli]|nr:hypothetical protein [Escherichia coli]
ESHFSAYLTLWFPLLIWWTPLCLIHQILTRRFRLYAYYWLIHDERSPLIWIDFTSLITAVKLYGIPPLSNANGS